ncbi:diguanylate cyclase [Trinickia sp. EG282A]|uniref:diguanylate cyclase n=1 Tax=Trinickia sp. EG282A TaxID=3237013 RepID=UPI0034D299DF
MRNGKQLLRWLEDQHFYRGLTAPHAIVAAGVITAFFMVAICAVSLYQSRLDAMARARDTSRNLAIIAERDIERNFELYALSLDAVVDGINDPEVMQSSPRLRREVLFDRAATATYLGSVLVLDATGEVIIDSGSDVPRKANFADRMYFTVHRDNPNVGVYVSDPYYSRLRGGSPSIALSRRISRPDGSFAGVVMVAIQLDYFHHLFAGLSLGPHGSVALIGRNGAMIMRQPYDVHVIGRNIRNASTFRHFVSEPEGSFSDISTIDSVQRLYYFKNFPHLPLIIMVADAHADIYAAWRRRAITIGSLIAAFAVAFIGLSFALGAQLQRRMRAESELAMLARTDGLTGLNNRRTLGEILEHEWRRARRTRSVFSLLFVDVDQFKAYNDTYGHQAGDDALTAIAKCISENIRQPADSAARYGGEEFVIVLPDTTPEGAAPIAEKIRTAISDLSIEHTGSEYGRVTASIGAAAWTPDEDTDVTAVIHAADQALYRAKATGRNKVALFTALPA